MGKNENDEKESAKLEQLKLTTEKHDKQLEKLQQCIDEVGNKLDLMAQTIENTHFKPSLTERITQKLPKTIRRVALLFVVLLIFSGVSLVFSAGLAEIIAQASFVCIAAAAAMEVIYLLIERIKTNTRNEQQVSQNE